MMYRNIFLMMVALATFSFTGCSSGSEEQKGDGKDSVLSGNITISGAFALYPMMTIWVEEFQKLHPDVRIDVSAGGAGKGMTDVLSGMVDVAMMSRDVKQEEIDKGAWYIAVTKDAVLPVVNANNPQIEKIKTVGLRKENFEALWLGKDALTWGKLLGTNDKSKVNVFTRSDACGAAEMWAKYIGKKQEDLLGTGVFGDPGIAEAVKSDVLGIGYNNVNYAYDITTKQLYPGIAIVPIDLDGSGAIESAEDFYGHLDSLVVAIRTGKYPSPPARDLFLVTKGKPSELVVKFMEWILTDGQKMIPQAGYVELPAEKLNAEKAKLTK